MEWRRMSQNQAVIAESSTRPGARNAEVSVVRAQRYRRPRSTEIFNRHGQNEYDSDRLTNGSTVTPSRMDLSDYRNSNKATKEPRNLLDCFAFLRRMKASSKASMGKGRVSRAETATSSERTHHMNQIPTSDYEDPIVLGQEHYIFRGKSAEVLGIITTPARTPRPASPLSLEERPESTKGEKELDDERFFYPPSTSSSMSTPYARKREGALRAARARARNKKKADRISDMIPAVDTEDKEYDESRKESWNNSLYAQDWYEDSSVDGEDIEIKEIVDWEKGEPKDSKQTTPKPRAPDTFEWMRLQAEPTSSEASEEDDGGNQEPVAYKMLEVEVIEKVSDKIDSPMELPMQGTRVEKSRETPEWVQQQIDADLITPVEALKPLPHYEPYTRPELSRSDSTDTFEWVALQVVELHTAPVKVTGRH